MDLQPKCSQRVFTNQRLHVCMNGSHTCFICHSLNNFGMLPYSSEYKGPLLLSVFLEIKGWVHVCEWCLEKEKSFIMPATLLISSEKILSSAAKPTNSLT